ncbi:hypothetical protein P154DRAFT_589281 [Amniculicola lignicola CBS 123094]|uniref:Uncharacterized protein n=1 Tax=Amniculicola lignicola CBS 123094 TaxID=1392246 RepID=A0A6A5VZX3_9PLEO|nr:hypothetical protein P154DRAFT_589281 [Amniculicola lignicola CBS 123094]
MSVFTEFNAWRDALWTAAASFVPPTLGPSPVRLYAAPTPSGTTFWYHMILMPIVIQLVEMAGSISAGLDDVSAATTDQDVLVSWIRPLRENLALALPDIRLLARELSAAELSALPEMLDWDWKRLAQLFGLLKNAALSNNHKLHPELWQVMFHMHEMWNLLGGDINSALASLASSALGMTPVPVQNCPRLPASPHVQPDLASTSSTTPSLIPTSGGNSSASAPTAAPAPPPSSPTVTKALTTFDKPEFINKLSRTTKRLTPILVALGMNREGTDGEICRAEAVLDYALTFEGITTAQISKSELGDWSHVAHSVWKRLANSDEPKLGGLKTKMQKVVGLFGL